MKAKTTIPHHLFTLLMIFILIHYININDINISKWYLVIHFHVSFQDSLTKLGVGAKDDIENWFTGEKLGSSG